MKCLSFGYLVLFAIVLLIVMAAMSITEWYGSVVGGLTLYWLAGILIGDSLCT